MKLRLGVFIFSLVLICLAFCFSNEQNVLEKIMASSSNFCVYEETDQAICFETDLSPENVISLLGAVVHSKQKLENENLEIFYCFVENVNNHVIVDGKKVNLQICLSNGKTILGFPLISTGY